MKKKERSVNIPTIEEVENEQKRLRHQAVYQRTLRGTIAVLLVVAAISVLVATLWMPVLQIYGSSMSPTLEAGQILMNAILSLWALFIFAWILNTNAEKSFSVIGSISP